MPNIFLEFSTLSVFVLLSFTVYLVILVVFIFAGRQYKGGVVGRAIQFIIATIGFFLAADIALFLVPASGLQISYTVHVILKICAMTCLAVGGVRLLVK